METLCDNKKDENLSIVGSQSGRIYILDFSTGKFLELEKQEVEP